MQVLEALRALVEPLSGGLPVCAGPLPPENGLSLTVSTGRVGKVTLAHGCTVALDVVLNLKHARQTDALDTLSRIHETLTRAQELPGGDGWQMLAIRTGGAPGYLALEGGQWLYGSALTVEYAVD